MRTFLVSGPERAVCEWVGGAGGPIYYECDAEEIQAESAADARALAWSLWRTRDWVTEWRGDGRNPLGAIHVEEIRPDPSDYAYWLAESWAAQPTEDER